MKLNRMEALYAIRVRRRYVSKRCVFALSQDKTIGALEEGFAERYGIAGAVATGSGRAAIYLAMEAIEVRGQRVLVPDFVCEQVLKAIKLAGGMPSFYPVPLDLMVRPEEFCASIPPDTQAALLIHYFGLPQRHVRELVGICRARGITLVEDCALALLTEADGGLCGAAGDYATFSFTKNQWCYGGGMAIARNTQDLAKVRILAGDRLVRDDLFCDRYGRLSELDFAANRPSLAHAAMQQGCALQNKFARTDTRFTHDNFFDAAPADLAMSPRAAARATEIVRAESACRQQRLRAAMEIVQLCGLSAGGPEGGTDLLGMAGNGSYLVFCDREAQAPDRIGRAGAEGITIRPAWCDYQSGVPKTAHSQRLMVIEVHPETDAQEAERIAHCVKVPLP